MRILGGAALAVAMMAVAGPAQALQVGSLDCRGQSQQYGLGSVTNLQCLFRSSAGGPPQHYAAQIRRIGVDVGVNTVTNLNWVVFAPGHPGAGQLQGVYVGGSANVTIGVGVGANALVGGSNNTIALQPVSGQSQQGFGVAGGVSQLELVAAQPRRMRKHHRRGRR